MNDAKGDARHFGKSAQNKTLLKISRLEIFIVA